MGFILLASSAWMGTSLYQHVAFCTQLSIGDNDLAGVHLLTRMDDVGYVFNNNGGL